MKFLTAASVLLLTGSAIAAPGTAMRSERTRKRIANRKSSPINRVDGPAGTDITHPQYSSNWAGAILVGTGYKEVTGTFKAPTPSTAGSGSAWVGIDGDTCTTAILQTGIDWTLSGGSVTYDAWYEWYPDYAYDFSGISISPGDEITVTVKASSKTGGVATIDNVTSGQKVTHTFSGEGSEGDLCQTNAEWIIEDFEEGTSEVKFADFGTVTFTGASATDGSGSVDTSGATIIDIQKSKILTDCSASGSSVTCKYV